MQSLSSKQAANSDLNFIARKFLYPACLVVLLAGLCFAKARSPRRASPAQTPYDSKGVVVLEATTNFGANIAGIQRNDVITGWSRGEKSGVIESPFTLMAIENSQGRLGGATLYGFHNGQRKSWGMGAIRWKIKTRPDLAPQTLEAFQQALQNAGVGKADLAIKECATLTQATHVPSWLFYTLGTELVQKRHFAEASDAYQHALVLTPKTDIARWYIFAAIADMNNQKPDFKASEAAYQESLATATEQNNPLLQANSLMNLVLAEWQLNELTAAEKHAIEAETILEPIAPKSMNMASALNWRAAVAKDQANLESARRFAEKALSVERELHCELCTETSVTINLLAQFEYVRGDLALAESHFEESVKIEEHFDPNDPNIPIALVGSMAVALDRYDSPRAERYAQRVFSLAENVPDSQNKALIYLQLADAYRSMGNDKEGEKFCRQTLAVLDKLRLRTIATTGALTSLAEIKIQEGNLAEAEQHLTLAIEIATEISRESPYRAEAMVNLGKIRLAQKRPIEALELYQQATAIFERTSPDSSFIARSYFGTAKAKSQMGDNAAALDSYAKAMKAVENQGDRLGGSSDSLAAFRAEHAEYYRQYADALITGGRSEEAFQISENFRARSLLQMLAGARVDIRQGADPALVHQEVSLRTDIRAKTDLRSQLLGDVSEVLRLKNVEKEISELLADYRDVEAKIRAASPAYAALTQPEPLTAKQVQQSVLDDDTLLIEYMLGTERSHVFAVTTDAVKVFDLPRRSEIETQSRRVYELLTEGNRLLAGESEAQRDKRWAQAAKEYEVAAANLSRMILAPVAENIQFKNKRLVIVADGALHYVPFAALPEPDLPTYRPLTVDHEIVSLPSASVLAVLREQNKNRKPAPNAVAVLADPVFNLDDPRVAGVGRQAHSGVAAVRDAAETVAMTSGDAIPGTTVDASLTESLLTRSVSDLGLSRDGRVSLPRLRYTREEADAIYSVTPRSKAFEATDFQANRATAISPELASFRIIHFATHGLLNSQHPELSGLVFSLVDKKGKPQDGFLTLQDIYNLNLPADLIVLSACETGLGKEISGEGLIGLTRGFMYAGASRVVASLWNVSDVATARLMAEFYRSMEKDGLAPAAALRAAQIKMLQQKRWASPYYWAAFQIQGEWK